MGLTATGSDAFYDASSTAQVLFLGVSWKAALGCFFQAEHLQAFLLCLSVLTKLTGTKFSLIPLVLFKQVWKN